jgi:hypothetical protein
MEICHNLKSERKIFQTKADCNFVKLGTDKKPCFKTIKISQILDLIRVQMAEINNTQQKMTPT